MHEQIEARVHDAISGEAEAFRRHLTRIRQRPDGQFEQRNVGGTWLPYLPGGFPYGQREVDALQARGEIITAENVLVRSRRAESMMPDDTNDCAMMPSQTKLRRWMILGVLLLSGALVLMVWTEIRWARVISLGEALHHLPRPTALLVGVSIGGPCFGALVLTRLLYCARREHRDHGRDV